MSSATLREQDTRWQQQKSIEVGIRVIQRPNQKEGWYIVYSGLFNNYQCLFLFVFYQIERAEVKMYPLLSRMCLCH